MRTTVLVSDLEGLRKTNKTARIVGRKSKPGLPKTNTKTKDTNHPIAVLNRFSGTELNFLETGSFEEATMYFCLINQIYLFFKDMSLFRNVRARHVSIGLVIEN
jgi:hypothetical protein